MSFNSFIGLFFAIAVVFLCWSLPGRFRNIFLLAASFIFYAYGDPIYALLLMVVILIGFVGGKLIARDLRPRLTLAGCAALLLVTLGIFKYFNFFTTGFAELLGQFGLSVDTVTLQILLPIGISFYTFQTLGYLIDVYRKNTGPEHNLVNFALFVSFFPQLVAGPIERSRNLLRQVNGHRAPPDRNGITYGFFLIIQGYAKKTVIADTLAPYVDLLFSQDDLSAPLIIVGLLFFALQIYGDFSGYTDIARGYSRLLGFKILLNFDRPYFATSPSNFWRRWHISLSSWFTEYLYFPLGGNRSRTRARRWGNVLATMGMSGLWHGAALNFIAWGLYHGALIIAQRGIGAIRPLAAWNKKTRAVPSQIATFILIVYGWLYFRVEDMSQLVAYNRALMTNWSGWFEAALILSQGVVVIATALVIDLMEKYWLSIYDFGIKRWRGLVPYMAASIVFVVLFASDASGSFIYFRF